MIVFIKRVIKKNFQFFKYCVVGTAAFVVDFSLLWFLTAVFHLWYLFSATLSFSLAVLVNYLLQRSWTFQSKQTRQRRQFTLFFAAQVIGLFINNTVLYILVEDVSLHYLAAKAFAAVVVLAWNFWASRLVIFNDKFYAGKPSLIIAGEIFPPDIGGPATYSYRLAKYLLSQGYRVHVICYSKTMPAREEEEFSGHITRVSAERPLLVKYFIYFIKLLNLAPRAKVIYAQGPVASAFPAYLVSKIFRRRLIIKIVGDYAWEQAQLHRVTDQNIDDWQVLPQLSISSPLSRWRIKALLRLERLCTRSADKIIVPSYYLKKIVCGWQVSPHNVQVIYNSVDFPQTANLSRAQAQKEINLSGDIIIAVARLVPWKGLDFIIGLMPELKKINPAFKLLIVGSGPDEPKLKKIIEALGLSQEVVMAGSCSRQDTARCYNAAKLFVLNSSYEGLSHVILEAMYFNLPIIVSDVSGNRELIENDYNGLIVGYNNKEEWIRAIGRLWNNAGLKERLAGNSLDKLDVFRFSNMIKQTLTVLDNEQTTR